MSGTRWSLSDQLAQACLVGNVAEAKAAVHSGASVNDKGSTPYYGTITPLMAAVWRRHRDTIIWLLSLGADPNGDDVMRGGAVAGCGSGTLQLLIDAGGDVNRRSGGELPLFSAVSNLQQDNVWCLLVQPSLDLAVVSTARMQAELSRAPRLTAVIADTMECEVRVRG